MIELPHLYHWSPALYHDRIQRYGLKPTTHTAVWVRPLEPGHRGHTVADLPESTLLGVCLGTSPQTAWAYSGALSAETGETWDLWEVELSDKDEVHTRPEMGARINEVRVMNRIPRSRIWFVGSRVRKRSRWYA